MKNSLLWIIAGILLIIGGIFALMNPFAATVAAEQIAAWCFLIGGVMQFVAAFRNEGWGGRIFGLVLAVAYLVLGAGLLFHPLVGIVTLTMMVAVMFLVNGVLKIVLAFSLRGTGLFWLSLISGVVSVALALMVFSNFLQASLTMLGILLAIELISSGVTMVTLGLFQRKHPEMEALA
ncbi:HdeD family acid-resistance protein [Pseudooceanicola sp. 502str34]|uniref:HdeD family acid-resistance protein n=1 Tax=Maritimibacter alkaliphilus TaxID=404236 RepID=UPI001C9533B8|nr:DUF308 domain-containing protein [Maritimibacter alkaliphilus]MBY6090893.1 DUF308 domain-containing protein [Maritimibacter alkaliphilus]